MVVPVSIQVFEIDKKYPDGPFPGAGKYSVDPSKGDKLDYPPLQVPITGMGAKGKSKDKKAMLNFYFEANITCRGGKNNRTTGEDGLNFIKSFEKVSATKYDDGYGNPTIGVGHKILLPQEKDYMTATLTDEEINALFAKDLAAREAIVCRGIKVCLKQNQFDALVSLVYNHGSLGDVGKRINANDTETAVRAAFNEYVKARNKKTGKLETSPGLVKRRKQEADMYFHS